MNFVTRFLILILAAIVGSGAVCAQDSNVQQEAKAIEVLKSMSSYMATMDRLVMKSKAFSDYRIGAGLMVSNGNEVEVVIHRPDSMHISNFDGVQSKEIFFHEGQLTVFSSENKYYAQANIPRKIEAAMEFALDELDVEAPMMDLIYRDVAAHLISSEQSILYLADKSRVNGTDCHHIVIRYPEVDLQLWVEEGDRPVPRRLQITSKWEGGSPRFIANISWDLNPELNEEIFQFQAPEGSTDIGFMANDMQEGE